MGYKRIEGSKLESRLLIEENGRMEIKYGSYTVYYGAVYRFSKVLILR